MTAERTPQVGEEWALRSNLDRSVTLLAEHEGWWFAKAKSGHVVVPTSHLLEFYAPPKPPLPEPPDTVWCTVDTDDGVPFVAGAYGSASSAHTHARAMYRPAVAEYRLHAVHEVER